MAVFPLFPLNLVVFPGEELNLHIFEPRYKQLIGDCLRDNTTFGIPSYVNQEIELGTEVKILDVERTYEDGRLDIKTSASRVFKVLEFFNPMEEKLYAGGVITPLEYDFEADKQVNNHLIDLAMEFFKVLKITNPMAQEEINSFSLGHKIGLTPQQEYELLAIPEENERQHYIIRHFERTIPVLREVEKTKQRISMNGHFKHLDPLNF